MVQQAGVTPRNPHQRWQFAVEIGGFDAGFFTTCSGVQTENEVSRFSPGGSIFDQKVVGRTNFPPITLEKGKAQEKVADAYGLNESPTVSGRERLTKWEQRLTDRFEAFVVTDALAGALNRGTWFKAWSEASTLDDAERDHFDDLSRRFGPEALARDGQHFANLFAGHSKAREP